MVDMLKVFISRAKTDGQFEGVIPHLVDDDTILFMDHDLDKARNMKLLLFAFELASGLKINFHKNELFCFGAAQENIELYTELFGYKAGNFPINYLGIPIHYRKLRNSDWVKVEERFEKKLSSWKGKHLSIGGRLTLINSVLTSLPMYMMSFFSIPKGVLKKLDYFRSRFFWQGDKNKKKYRLAKWTFLCQPKDQGGLGILDLNTKNVALLSKWLYRLIASDGLWQQILRNKYVGSKPLAQVEWKVGDSHFWSCLMKAKLDFLRFGTFIVKDGTQVRFCEDNWLDGTPLRNQYPSLYNIARSKFITIADLSWRRHLFGTNLDDWNTLLARIEGLELSQDQDAFYWNLTPNDRFSVKSHYAALMLRNIPNVNTNLWKLKAPLKVKIFLWYLRKGVILTKDNLAKRRWQGSLTCAFCHKEETINHLFFECRLARSVWSVLQIATGINQPQNVNHMFGDWLQGFNKTSKTVFLLGAAVLCWALWIGRNDLVILSVTHWLSDWVILQREEVQPLVAAGSRLLARTAPEYILDKVLESTSKGGWQKSFEVGMLLVRDDGFRDVRKE
ncbi:hypothetical protein U9M48_011857, partial [Paspalum notatum var. saurae]